MMPIYLPIAEISVNAFTILLLGGVTGILSGIFGIGGGFLMTPFLIFFGISPAVAVASSTNQIVAASVSGFTTHLRRKNVDFQMGGLLLIGGLSGSTLGVYLFSILSNLGQIDLVISLCYIFFLGSIGVFMAIDAIKLIWRSKHQNIPAPPIRKWKILEILPFKIYFKRSDMQLSLFAPILIGLFVGILVSIMGVGGGFFMIPAMIYILRIPTIIVVGTSLFQVIFVTANVTFLHAVSTNTVDIILALLLLTGSVIGTQIGVRIGAKLPTEQMRGLMAMLVLAVAGRLALTLLLTPNDLFSVAIK